MSDLVVVYLIVVPLALVVGAVIGHFITRYVLEKQMKEWQKQMGEPDREQVRNMLSALGQRPSEEKVNRFINLTKERQEKKKPVKTKTPKKKK